MSDDTSLLDLVFHNSLISHYDAYTHFQLVISERPKHENKIIYLCLVCAAMHNVLHMLTSTRYCGVKANIT